MNLYLVQHAEAKAKDADPQRPLTETGRVDLKKTVGFLAKQSDLTIDTILHSGKIRAKQTAEIIGETLKQAQGVEETDGLQPLDDPRIWADRLGDMITDTMLVGHLPHLSRLAAHLLSGDQNKEIIGFQMGGVVCLSSDEMSKWILEWIVIPKILPI